MRSDVGFLDAVIQSRVSCRASRGGKAAQADQPGHDVEEVGSRASSTPAEPGWPAAHGRRHLHHVQAGAREAAAAAGPRCWRARLATRRRRGRRPGTPPTPAAPGSSGAFRAGSPRSRAPPRGERRRELPDMGGRIGQEQEHPAREDDVVVRARGSATRARLARHSRPAPRPSRLDRRAMPAANASEGSTTSTGPPHAAPQLAVQRSGAGADFEHRRSPADLQAIEERMRGRVPEARLRPQPRGFQWRCRPAGRCRSAGAASPTTILHGSLKPGRRRSMRRV